MADPNKEMSWDEAETIARECTREFKAAEKIHLACVKVRTETETIAKIKVEYDTVQRSLDGATARLIEAKRQADMAEADAATRIATANARIFDTESKAVDTVAKVNQQAQQAKDALLAAQAAHREGLAKLQQEFDKTRRQLESQHASIVALYGDEEAHAKAERDKAVEMFTQYLEKVRV